MATYSIIAALLEVSLNTGYLGRPWREYAKVVILNSEIGDHIKPEGWHDWGKIDAHDTVYFVDTKIMAPVPQVRARHGHIH